MANSKYEYVKGFEVEDEVMMPSLIVVRVYGCGFQKFSQVHEFKRPNDEQALNLMNLCAITLLEEYPDIVFSYGFSDEYSFIFKKLNKFYQRRASKISSLLVSFFASLYVTKWKEFFPHQDLRYPPTFRGKVIPCASFEVLQHYLAWRQRECHLGNQYNTCLWKMVEHGISEKEAHESLKGADKHEKNELLFHQFGINYKSLPQILRQGSCALKKKAEDIVKYSRNGIPVKRLRTKACIVHNENIAGKDFWNENPSILKDLGGRMLEDILRIEPDYIRSFIFESRILPSTWIVVRIDGCHFHRFSDIHEFEKPNDKQALELMNTCAVAVLLELEDVIFAYGHSDEYSFLLKKDSMFCQRKSSEIVSIIVSLFTSSYVMKWKTFFPQKELKYHPCFDGRAVCYPSTEIVLDYVSWRQVDCHINNQYNTCFWLLVKSGKAKTEAQLALKGTLAQDKCDLLAHQFGLNYSTLPSIFRFGSSVFREDVLNEKGTSSQSVTRRVVVKHCDVIQPSFWRENPSILA